MEGSLEARVWREERTPLERLVVGYANRDETESPVERDRRAREQLPLMQREVLAATPKVQRPAAHIVLRMAAANLPLRGVGKRAYLQGRDVTRAAARRAGELLVAGDVLDDPEDTLYLTWQELSGGGLPRNARELVGRRRERRAGYTRLQIPTEWRGVPTPAASDDGLVGSANSVTGVGASAGVAEGVARVVTDPTSIDVGQGEILVAATTDPSWASVMFVCSGLVVDIGGLMSHAAVVARELGVPCVVNTRVGTRVIRTGDRVRVDGSTGSVEVLARAAGGVKANAAGA
jgi:pyruvate,water dikinase